MHYNNTPSTVLKLNISIFVLSHFLYKQNVVMQFFLLNVFSSDRKSVV